jgi:hypothetical protein
MLIRNTTALSAIVPPRSDGTYTYNVQACNTAGCGPTTPDFSVTTINTPSAPGAISGSSTSATGSISLSWGAASGSVASYVLTENGPTILNTVVRAI